MIDTLLQGVIFIAWPAKRRQRPRSFTKVSVKRNSASKGWPPEIPFVGVTPVTTAESPCIRAFNVVVLKNLVFRIAFFRFGEIIDPCAYLSPGVDQDVILHHGLFDAGGIAVLVAEREFVFRAQNIIFISSLE